MTGNIVDVFPIGEGEVRVSRLINPADHDFGDLLIIACVFANQGSVVELTPKITRRKEFDYDSVYGSLKGTRYYGKCPDLNVDGKWYEYEGFTSSNPKNALRNMITNGLKQANRLIIRSPKLRWRDILRVVNHRVSMGQDIEELWVYNRNSLELIYKKLEADLEGQPPL